MMQYRVGFFCILLYPWKYLLIVSDLCFDSEYLYTLIFLFQSGIPSIEK